MTCKYGKLKHPVGRRKCKKAPRGRATRNLFAYSPSMAGSRRRRRRRR